MPLGIKDIVITLFVALMTYLVWAYQTPAPAHDWYPPQCCHEMEFKPGTDEVLKGDCGPADLLGQRPDGTLFKQRRTNLIVLVPKGSYYHPNPVDADYHVCARNDPAMGVVFYCVFEPSMSYRRDPHHK